MWAEIGGHAWELRGALLAMRGSVATVNGNCSNIIRITLNRRSKSSIEKAIVHSNYYNRVFMIRDRSRNYVRSIIIFHSMVLKLRVDNDV
jgi:hypothetical protein